MKSFPIDSETAGNGHPAELCGYRVVGALPGGHSCVAELPGGGGRVVLKPLRPECLLDGQLHPGVRERLSRVRELAEKTVANLHGVVRDPRVGQAFLVWDYLPGTPLSDDGSVRGLSHRDLLIATRELLLAVESLHAAGLVHGALTPGNIILDPARLPRLTHLSPLLHDESGRDAQAVVDAVRQVLERRGESHLPLGRLLAEARREGFALDVLRARVGSLRVRDGMAGEAQDVADTRDVMAASRVRSRALVGTAATVVLSASVIAGTYWFARRSAAPDPYAAPTGPAKSTPAAPEVERR